MLESKSPDNVDKEVCKPPEWSEKRKRTKQIDAHLEKTVFQNTFNATQGLFWREKEKKSSFRIDRKLQGKYKVYVPGSYQYDKHSSSTTCRRGADESTKMDSPA